MKEEVDWKKKKKMDAESYAAVCVGVRIPMGDHREGSRGSKMRLRQGKKKKATKKNTQRAYRARWRVFTSFCKPNFPLLLGLCEGRYGGKGEVACC